MDNMFKYVFSRTRDDVSRVDFTVDLPEFIGEFSLNTCKIHVIYGNNGSGKSTLLEYIANQWSNGVIPSHYRDDRLQVGSNDERLTRMFNKTAYSGHTFKPVYPLEVNLLMYMDLSVQFHNMPTQCNDLDRIGVSLSGYSNGEQKILELNKIFSSLKLFVHNAIPVDTEGMFHVNVLLDEPESGLDDRTQKEFMDRMLYYMRSMDSRIVLTVVIVSHSHVWREDDVVEIHNISDFTIKDKKRRKRVFV